MCRWSEVDSSANTTARFANPDESEDERKQQKEWMQEKAQPKAKSTQGRKHGRIEVVQERFGFHVRLPLHWKDRLHGNGRSAPIAKRWPFLARVWVAETARARVIAARLI